MVDGCMFLILLRVDHEPAGNAVALDLDKLQGSQIMHIGHMCKSPYRPTLHMMSALTWDEPDVLLEVIIIYSTL